MYYKINSKFKLLKNNRIKTFYIYAKEEKDIQQYYKDWEIRNGEGIICTGGTFAISFANAVERLHEWICENNWAVQEYPKAVFGIEVIDGTLDRRGEIRRVEVYRISAGKAKKYL